MIDAPSRLDRLGLRAHQDRATIFVRERDGNAPIFAEMSTGKTRMGLAVSVDSRYQHVLVICPISAMSGWRDEINACLSEATYLILDNTMTMPKKVKAFAGWVQHGEPAILIVNWESFWRKPLFKMIRDWHPDLVIADEAHAIRHRATQQSRSLHILGDQPFVRSKLALTGTPMGQGLQDLWSIYRFANPKVFGYRYADFQAKYLVMGGFHNKQIVGYRDIDEVKQKVAQSAFIVSKDEVLDLPPRQDIKVEVELTQKSMAKYRELMDHAVAELEGVDPVTGLPKRGTAVSTITLTALLRGQQLSSGFIGTDDDQIIDVSTEKLDMCMDLLDTVLANKEKAVIFCRFRHDIQRIVDRCATAHIDSGVIWGDQGRDERDEVLQDLLHGSLPVVVAQIHSGSTGINEMVAASVGIFYSVGFQLIDFQQARDRLHREGQKRKVTYYHLICRNTVDVKVYDQLRRNVAVAGRVANLSYAKWLLT